MRSTLKPWQTKEWREKRDQFIKGKKCVQCESSEILVVHHLNSIMPYQQHYYAVSNALLAEKISGGEYKTEQKQIQTCPKCNTHRPSDLKARKVKKPRYRCSNCGNEFEESIIGYKETGRLSKPDWNHYIDKYRDHIKEIVQAQRDEYHEYYLTFEDCIVLCNRCHLALHKGMKLCPICKEKYHKTSYAMCWDCFTKTPRGKEVLARREKEEYENQMVEIENPLCDKKHQVARGFAEFGGIFHLCHRDCTPYDCEKFEKWYNDDMDGESDIIDLSEAKVIDGSKPCSKRNECEHYRHNECYEITQCPFK